MKESKKISRRGFLSGVASTAATTCIPAAGVAALVGAATTASAQYTHVGASREVVTPAPIVVEGSGYRLMMDGTKGAIISLRSTYGDGRELLVSNHGNLPLFNIELMNERREFKTVSASDARKITIKRAGHTSQQSILIEFTSVGGLELDASVTIHCPQNESLTYWSLEIDNRTGEWIGHIQFPVVEVPFDNPLDRDPGYILWSDQDGQMIRPLGTAISTPWYLAQTRNTPDIWRANNYPGNWVTTQLMAYYSRAGGLYMACDDPTGLPKFIRPLMENDGVRMGLGHFPGTRTPGKKKLPYRVVLGTFLGDWYAAAEIYRDWASKQPFCREKLAQRRDMPKWITESPVAIAFPMRGQGDWDPPATVNPEYCPATNALPYLDKISQALGSSLIPIIFNWEHHGPWVQPDGFPAIGGDAAMREYMAKAKERGWHPLIYGNGLRWVTSQKNTNYDGMPYFHAQGGDQTMAQNWDGKFIEDVWPWRKNYFMCVGAAKTHKLLLDMTRGMADYGPQIVQQFDQGPGPQVCYAADHGHPPVPGPWMMEDFKELIKADVAEARSKESAMALSCEGAPPEVYLQDFQVWDARVSVCPLYAFLYHEYGHGFQGFFTNRKSDESLRASVARAIVTGYMVCLTLRDKGLIAYDWDQTWSRAIPDQVAILDWTKRLNQFRAGIARDYLIFGKMLRPWTVTHVTERDLGWGNEPLVPSATWQAPDGRIGTVLANFSDLGETPRVELPGEGTKQVTLYLDGAKTERMMQLPATLDLEMEPRSICLVEVK